MSGQQLRVGAIEMAEAVKKQSVEAAEVEHLLGAATGGLHAGNKESGEMTQCNSDGNGNSNTQSQLDTRKLPEVLEHSGAEATTIIPATPRSANDAVRQIAITSDDKATNNDDGVYKGPKAWLWLVRHWSTISLPTSILAILIALWTIAYILLPEYAAPHTGIMRMLFLFLGAHICGMLMQMVHLPDMLGMLAFGVLYTNVGLGDFGDFRPLEAFLREMALINIMLLAGFGLDARAFRKLWFMILRLTLVPTLAEVTIIAVFARYVLAMPWTWGIALGLVITAVSPNVVVTVMLHLREQRLGLNNGIHTLIYAMTTCNDVVAIFLFGVILGVIFSKGSLTQQILQGPIGIGIGVVYGYIYGLMLQFLPSPKTPYVHGVRFILTVLGGAIAVMGSKVIGYPSAGVLGCVTIAFIASLGWKRQQQRQQLPFGSSTVPERLDLLWTFLKPVSFALIGKEINFGLLDANVVGYGALLVLLGSLFRLAFAYISTYGGQLTWQERAYITISGFPKATVQAALGPVALDTARSLGADAESLSLASQVLVISVLAIIFTAPLGAVLMLRLAPRWLRRSSAVGDDAVTTQTPVQQQNSGVIVDVLAMMDVPRQAQKNLSNAGAGNYSTNNNGQ